LGKTVGVQIPLAIMLRPIIHKKERKKEKTKACKFFEVQRALLPHLLVKFSAAHDNHYVFVSIKCEKIIDKIQVTLISSVAHPIQF